MRSLIFSFLTLLVLNTSALAGIRIDASQIIVEESAATRGKTVGVTSTSSADVPYLVKAYATRDLDGKDNRTPFIVNPSLFRLEPGTTHQLVLLSTLNHLPKDRESHFYFRTVAMPSSSPLSDINSDKAATLKVAVGNIIDLFYRPDNLPMSKQNAMEKLTFKALPAGEIQVKNPTPYYLPLASLRINQQAIKLGKKNIIPPFGEQVFVSKSRSGKVEYRVINDLGGRETFYGTVQ